MKKIDKLILGAFVGPFSITFVVVVFILLTQYMLKYIEDFIGKGLGFPIFVELLFYFALNMTTIALPLAVLLSSLMTFGNLAEHNELTAIKGAGVSLPRALLPIFIVVLILTGGIFMFNDQVLPKVNLKAYSLLYDIRQKKPSLNFKEGTFYNGLPGYSIKVSKKFPGGRSLKGVMIYDHTSGRANSNLILADSGYTYTIYNDRYLILELFNGKSYNEIYDQNDPKALQYVRNNFKKCKLIFSLASFNLERTKEELFKGNRMMNNIQELNEYVDSSRNEYYMLIERLSKSIRAYYTYFSDTSHFHAMPLTENTADFSSSRNILPLRYPQYARTSLRSRQDTKFTLSNPVENEAIPQGKQSFLITSKNSHEDPKAQSYTIAVIAEDAAKKMQILLKATNQARGIKSFTLSNKQRLKSIDRDANNYEIEIYRKYTQSIACIIFFMIGAPLGAIIKKGGLGIPVIISILFFIIFYVLSIIGEKWAKEGIVLIPYGMWAADLILLPIGLFLIRQAKNDSRLLDIDAWAVLWQKIRPGQKSKK